CTEKTFPFSPVQAYDKNLTWRSGRCPARAMMPELLPVVQNDEQKFLSIITHRLPLADGPAAYSSFASRSEGMLKVMLRP
ncbi:MAG: hypothetical protein RL161_1225, partial [Bacteroidota bacterium]